MYYFKNIAKFLVALLALVGMIGGIGYTAWIGEYFITFDIALLGVLAAFKAKELISDFAW